MKVEFYRHSLGEAEKLELTDTLDSLFLTTGPKTKQFESSFADYLGNAHCLGVTSWTMGNFITLKAMGIGPGDKVLTTPMTYVATANTVLHCGAEPVFADVDPGSGIIDPEKADEVLGKDDRIKALIVVHLYGQMADMKALRQITESHGVLLLEDCAHCVEGVRDGIRPGNLSDAAVFSFYATKNLTCGEGGAIVTNDEALAGKIKPLRLHGVNTSPSEKHQDKTYKHWDMNVLGYKCNMSDVSASLLIPQLPKLEEQRQIRKRLFKGYDELLSEFVEIEKPSVLAGSTHAHHLYTIRVPPQKRDQLLGKLTQSGIGVGVNFRAVHLLQFYREKFGYRKGSFPIAERIGDSTISLPLYPSLKSGEQEYVAEKLRQFLE